MRVHAGTALMLTLVCVCKTGGGKWSDDDYDVFDVMHPGAVVGDHGRSLSRSPTPFLEVRPWSPWSGGGQLNNRTEANHGDQFVNESFRIDIALPSSFAGPP